MIPSAFLTSNSSVLVVPGLATEIFTGPAATLALPGSQRAWVSVTASSLAEPDAWPVVEDDEESSPQAARAVAASATHPAAARPRAGIRGRFMWRWLARGSRNGRERGCAAATGRRSASGSRRPAT